MPVLHDQDIISKWGAEIDPSKPILPEYPRPQLTRASSTYKNLNGLWEWTASTEGAPVPFGTKLGSFGRVGVRVVVVASKQSVTECGTQVTLTHTCGR